jgi:MoaA/NifB/PqqE/SkfB family radical SAM enzyme
MLVRNIPPNILNFLLRRDMIRRTALNKAEASLDHHFVTENPHNRPRKVQEARAKMLKNLLHSVDRAIADNRISSRVSRSILKNFVGKVIYAENNRLRKFTEEHGFGPPAFLTISPTKRCNLYCTGCYASSSAGQSETLPYPVFQRILREKRELWGSHFSVISGGEPLMYKDQGKTIYDVFENNRHDYFLMYTNGTLITKEVARRMADLGNVTPAISIEGFEAETDERRGTGVYAKILQAMDNLREVGLPFGVSFTATKNNVHCILDETFTDLYFGQLGAVYAWIFQYMPIGRSYTVDLMITPEQRLELFKTEQRMIKESGIFLVDFWNGGPYSMGCISAGRPGGYFYIDWNGNIAPCVFYPYYEWNVEQLYREGKDLNDVLFSSYFGSIRDWQNDYGFAKPPDRMKNYITPCMMRDHHGDAHRLIRACHAKPMDENAAEALEDAEYRERMISCGNTVHTLTKPYWESEFMDPVDESASTDTA